MAILKTESEHLYLQIANRIEQQIMQQVLNIGDKLPSVRSLGIHHAVSMATVLQAYYHLEGKGLIESRPKSGYYIRFNPNRFPDRPGKSQLSQASGSKDVDSIISDVYDDWNDPSVTRFSISVPAAKMLPLAALRKATIQALRELPDSGTAYEPVQGNALLRRQIARWSLNWEGSIAEGDLITTAGCMNAITYCLMSITKSGDMVAVESPAYFGTLRLLKSLGLKVLELPTDAATGVDPADVNNALQKHKVKACLFVTNFSNPLGCCIPDEQKKTLVDVLSFHGVPLIEDDLYGDVYFGRKRPKSCKSFDEEGNVLWCSSISKTLAPGYRVGWVAPGKYFEQVKRQKLYQSITSASVQQMTIANFLSTGRYEHHLRKLRAALHANSLQYIRAIAEYFPKGAKVSRPKGGFILWVELPKNVDSYELYKDAMLYKISIAPGTMFSLQDRYKNCMRLSYGIPWSSELERALKRLGTIAKRMM